MCGLIGITRGNAAEQIRAVLPVIAHRGPDGSGVYADDSVSLGHVRLAIIDPVHGGQPFHTEDGGHVLAFNGEVYNFRELAETLRQRGIRLRTQSDTEVLAYWLREFGVDGLADLNGMFAIAFWDRRARRLLLARDRFGIKPLYLGRIADGLAFGSEIKALMPWIRPRPNYGAIGQFLTFQNVLSQDTFFAGIEKFEPGGWLTWTDGEVRRGQFWRLSFPEPDRRDAREVAAEYRERFEGAVRRHMIADVPLGSYLSGGIDSASVAVAAARLAGAPLNTFTGVFEDAPYYDERQGSRAVARQIGAEAHEVVIRPENFVSDFPDVMWHLDEPMLGTGALPHYEVARLVGKHVKVVLTGHGGDELFAGYQVNKAFLIRDALRQGPLATLRAIASVRPDEATRVLYFLLYPFVDADVRHGLFVMTPRRARSRWFGDALRDGAVAGEPFNALQAHLDGRGYTPSQALFALYLRTYLQTLLVQEDKVGMAHSIEARTPICDNTLLDLALSVPLSTKLAGGQLKAIPKMAMRPDLPPVLGTLPKRGFPTPFARWFRTGPAHDLVADLVGSAETARRGVFDAESARALLDRNGRSSLDTLADYARANRLYSLAAIELWFRTFVDGDGLRARHPALSVGCFSERTSARGDAVAASP